MPLASPEEDQWALNEGSRRPGYLSKHDDVESDAVGFDECAALGAGQVVVVYLANLVKEARLEGKGTGRPETASGSC